MIRLLVRLGLALLVVNLLLPPIEAFQSRGGSYYGKYGKPQQNEPGRPKTFAGTSSGLPSQNATRRGLGISAWGIVAVVVAIIVAGMGLYYASICYNICQPNKGKYDKMTLPMKA